MQAITLVITVQMIFDVLLNKKKLCIKERPEKLSILCLKSPFLDLKKAFEIKKAQFQKAAGRGKEQEQERSPDYNLQNGTEMFVHI